MEFRSVLRVAFVSSLPSTDGPSTVPGSVPWPRSSERTAPNCPKRQSFEQFASEETLSPKRRNVKKDN